MRVVFKLLLQIETFANALTPVHDPSAGIYLSTGLIKNVIVFSCILPNIKRMNSRLNRIINPLPLQHMLDKNKGRFFLFFFNHFCTIIIIIIFSRRANKPTRNIKGHKNIK